MVVLLEAVFPSSSSSSSRICSFSSSSPLAYPSINNSILKTSKSTRYNYPSFYVKPAKSVIFLSVSKRVYQKTHHGKWEEPDDGNSSEDEDEEEQDDWGEEDEVEEENREVSLSTSYITKPQSDEEFIKEVEQLLDPEERAILEQYKAPNIGKISTAKWRPLHTLALSGQIRFMDKLLQVGVDIDAVDKDGFTALHKAVIGKKEPVISHLLRKGANPNIADSDGATPLHYAVQVGAVLTVKLFIKYKVDVNVADNHGWTPLHVAVQARSKDIAKILLKNGADRTRRNKDGKTPLHLSLCYGKDFKSYELAKLLKLVPAYTHS